MATISSAAVVGAPSSVEVDSCAATKTQEPQAPEGLGFTAPGGDGFAATKPSGKRGGGILLPGQVLGLTVLSILVPICSPWFAKFVTVAWQSFSNNGVGGYTAEITLILSVVLLLLITGKGSKAKLAKCFGGSGAGPAVRKTTRRGAEANAAPAHERSSSGGSGSTSATRSLTPPSRKGGNAMVAKLNHAIDHAARSGDLEKAERLIEDFKLSGGHPETVSYNLVLRACAKRGDAAGAEKWLKRMQANGVQATVCSYNTMLDACAKANQVEACERWLRYMLDNGIEANVISFATAIYARARRGDVEGAAAWLHKMVAAGVRPDAVSYNSLIHAHGVKGDAQGAERWVQEMDAQGLETSVATYTAVIDACAKSGDIERAEAWFSRLLNKGVEPNVVTFCAMIDACAKSGSLARAEHWHAQMLERGIAPNAHSYSAVINACAKHVGPGGAEAAEQWLDRSEQAGVLNDVVVYSSVIDACGKAGDAERALRVFRRMRANGLKPHIVAYTALARPFAYRGDWIKVESIAQSMASDGVKLNEYYIYTQLLSYAVARPRQDASAEACFRSALKVGVAANDHIVGVLARAVGRPRCMELMEELCGGREVPVQPSRRGQDGGRSGNGGGAGGRAGRTGIGARAGRQ